MTKIDGVLPLEDGERVLMLKPKDDHTLIVTTKRLFVERDGKVTPVTLPEDFVK